MNGKEKTVEVFVKSGKVKASFEAAKLAGRVLSNEEIDTLIKICEEKRWLEEALLAAELGGKDETAKDIAEKMAEQMKGKWSKEYIAKFAEEHCRIEVSQKIYKEIYDEKRRDEEEREANKNGISGINTNLNEEQWVNFVTGLVLEQKYNPARFLINKKDKNGNMVKRAIELCLEHGEFIWAAEFLSCRSATKEMSELVLKVCLESNDAWGLSWLIDKPGIDKDTQEIILKKILNSEDVYHRADEVVRKMGRWLSQDEVDGMIVMLCEKGLFDKVNEELKKRHLSSKGYEGLLTAYVKHGCLNDAKKIAKLLGRGLTTNETAIVIRYWLGKNEQSFRSFVAEEAAKLGTTQEAVSELIRHYLKYGFIRPDELIGELKADREVIEEVLEHGIKKGYADYILNAVKLLDRDLTTEEIDSFVNNKLSKRNNRFEIFKIAELGASPEVVRKIRKDAVSSGCLEDAKKAAKILNENLTQEEIQKIVDSCVRWGSVIPAMEAAELLTD